MKKRAWISGFMISIGLAFCFIFSSTKAWFSHELVLENSIDGKTEGAFFAYGDGSKDSPYGITNARHLYNLSWLQYLGRFNKDSDEDGKIDTVYFELGNDIDMNGYTALPPIGTTKYPFIGNFTGEPSHNTIDSSQNGKCHTISNLTITNDFSKYSYHATTADENDFGTSTSSVTQIVGLFGVIGSYNGNPSDAIYDSNSNSIANVGLENLTVQTIASSTLIGLVAGYVNGTITGVPVNNSSIDIQNKNASYISTSMTSNLSDYSLIGYAAKDEYLQTLQSSEATADIPEVSNPLLSQGGDDWGGSIDMKTMYTNLQSKLNSAKNSGSYKEDYISHEEEERNATLDSNNDIQVTSGYTPITNAAETKQYTYDTYTTQSSYTTYYHYYLKDTRTDSQSKYVTTSTYTLIRKGTLDSYVGLSGREERSTYEYTKDSITHISGSANYIYSELYKVYLSATYTGITTETSKDSSQAWIISSDGYIFTYLGNDINTRYYLSANGTSLTISNNKITTWEWDSINKTYKTGSYYLYYDITSNSWKLTNSLQTSTFYYTISSNGNYLLTNGTSGINQNGTTDESEATHWYFENGTYGYIYTYINGTKYYINVSRGQQNISLSTSSSNSSLSRSNGSNYLSCRSGRSTYYLYLNNNTWTASSTQNTVTITNKTVDNSLTVSKTDKWDVSGTSSETKSLKTYATYYPLTWEDGNTTNPSNKNTGYVIGGSHYDVNTLGDVRLASYYKIGYLSGSGQTSGNNHKNTSYSANSLYAYTFDSKGELAKIADPINGLESTSGYTSYSNLGLTKYYYSLAGTKSGSRVSLDSMLNDGTAYGLHFMNANIENTEDHKITIPYAKINGEEHYDYELPEDAIDFNLKTGGLINFFAHTGYVNTSDSSVDYTNSNNCFFSLHYIDRDGGKIANIKQIAKIYKNTEYDSDSSKPRYVYTYRDSNDKEITNSYDTGVKDTSGNIITGTKGDQVFDTYWLTDPNYANWVNYAAYYFEVPINKGEYALGSCNGKTDTTRGWSRAYNKNGAYLMYLDIGASQKNTNAITINEHYEITDNFYKYPLGTDFKSIDSLINDFSSVQGGESSAIKINASHHGETIKFIYTESISTSTTKSSLVVDSTQGDYEATYKTINTSVTARGSPSTEIEVVPYESHTTVYDRETLYDLTSGSGIDGTTYDTSQTTTITTHVGESDETTTISDPIIGTITLTSDDISNIVNVSFEDDETDRTLFAVEYCASIDSSDNPIEIELSYDSVTHTYTINFVTSENNPSNALIRFTQLNTEFKQEIDGKETSINYNIAIKNNGVDGNPIENVSLNTFYSIVINSKS